MKTDFQKVPRSKQYQEALKGFVPEFGVHADRELVDRIARFDRKLLRVRDIEKMYEIIEQKKYRLMTKAIRDIQVEENNIIRVLNRRKEDDIL